MTNTTAMSQPSKALLVSTLAFAMNFSVWILYAALGLELSERLSLTSTELGLLLASPMLTGAVSCFMLGIFADKYNPKSVFVWQMLAVAPALFLIPYLTTYSHYIAIGFWLGISGGAFTIGIRYVCDWFDRSVQGTAMGVFGAGNVGAAISLVLVPLLINNWGWNILGPVYGSSLALIAVLFLWLAPAKKAHKHHDVSTTPFSFSVLKRLKVWRFGLYYYFIFGSFLALILWLPQYYVKVYQVTHDQAMAFTLFFVISSGMVRSLGGWFADKYGGKTVNWAVFWICLSCLFFLCYPDSTITIHGINKDVHLNININVWLFSILIFIIGIAQGFGRASIYKSIHDNYPTKMGLVGGFVAACGAIGGCTLPIGFGLIIDKVGIYSACFMLLYAVLATCMIVMFFANKKDRFRERVQAAQQYNFLDDD